MLEYTSPRVGSDIEITCSDDVKLYFSRFNLTSDFTGGCKYFENLFRSGMKDSKMAVDNMIHTSLDFSSKCVTMFFNEIFGQVQKCEINLLVEYVELLDFICAFPKIADEKLYSMVLMMIDEKLTDDVDLYVIYDKPRTPTEVIRETILFQLRKLSPKCQTSFSSPFGELTLKSTFYDDYTELLEHLRLETTRQDSITDFRTLCRGILILNILFLPKTNSTKTMLEMLRPQDIIFMFKFLSNLMECSDDRESTFQVFQTMTRFTLSQIVSVRDEHVINIPESGNVCVGFTISDNWISFIVNILWIIDRMKDCDSSMTCTVIDFCQNILSNSIKRELMNFEKMYRYNICDICNTDCTMINNFCDKHHQYVRPLFNQIISSNIPREILHRMKIKSNTSGKVKLLMTCVNELIENQ